MVKCIKIDDRVYGTIEIVEPVLIELISSRPLQRLKGVRQAGAAPFAIKGRDVTRYEHSVGVMLLLKMLNAPLEEQIAGLIHDIPHTAFSHVIDFVFKSSSHDFHERFREQILLNSEIPSILNKFGFSIERLLDEHNFPLLERKIPDLCADRIDYMVRDMVARYGFKQKIKKYIDSFVIRNNEIIIKGRSIAKMFAEDFLKMDEKNWSSIIEVALFQILADAIKIALEERIISEDDLFQTDFYVLNKLKNSNNSEILQKLNMLNPNLKIRNNPNDYDFHSVNKLRYVDPKFIDSDGSVRRLSDVDPSFRKRLKEHKRFIQKGNFIKIVSW